MSWKKRKNPKGFLAAWLPDDIMESYILPRLSAKSLIRFKCVSKNWYRFVSSPRPRFIQMQSQHAASGLIRFSSFLSRDPAAIGINPAFCDNFEADAGSAPAIVASCNGLLCIRDFTMWVDVAAMNYNLVVLRQLFPYANRYRFHIFSSASEHWKLVKEQFELPAGSRCIREVCVCVKGSNLYWELDHGSQALWFRPQEELCSLQPLPHDASLAAREHKIAGEFDGKYCYATITGEEIQMWSLEHSHYWSKRLSITLGGSVGRKLKFSCHKMQLRTKKQCDDYAPQVVLMPFEGGDSLSFSVDGIMYCLDTMIGKIHKKGNEKLALGKGQHIKHLKV